MNNNIYWAWAIKNSVCAICWTSLAIKFNKWWIALFILLTMSSLTTNCATYRICDKCGKHSPYANSYNEALEKAKEVGWVHFVDGDQDYCADCKEV
jgi:hypothetical protein